MSLATLQRDKAINLRCKHRRIKTHSSRKSRTLSMTVVPTKSYLTSTTASTIWSMSWHLVVVAPLNSIHMERVLRKMTDWEANEVGSGISGNVHQTNMQSTTVEQPSAIRTESQSSSGPIASSAARNISQMDYDYEALDQLATGHKFMNLRLQEENRILRINADKHHRVHEEDVRRRTAQETENIDRVYSLQNELAQQPQDIRTLAQPHVEHSPMPNQALALRAARPQHITAQPSPIAASTPNKNVAAAPATMATRAQATMQMVSTSAGTRASVITNVEKHIETPILSAPVPFRSPLVVPQHNETPIANNTPNMQDIMQAIHSVAENQKQIVHHNISMIHELEQRMDARFDGTTNLDFFEHVYSKFVLSNNNFNAEAEYAILLYHITGPAKNCISLAKDSHNAIMTTFCSLKKVYGKVSNRHSLISKLQKMPFHQTDPEAMRLDVVKIAGILQQLKDKGVPATDHMVSGAIRAKLPADFKKSLARYTVEIGEDNITHDQILDLISSEMEVTTIEHTFTSQMNQPPMNELPESYAHPQDNKATRAQTPREGIQFTLHHNIRMNTQIPPPPCAEARPMVTWTPFATI
ncbi:hypothetical protein CRE_14188 [Caenorhabditis remanei]|uniref:Uncharacterized protein n=1 Tax=Caenorhabditis remanei TaxID=31234 RepID=E3N1K1_CAERE|nr:hypothetical protein CRE_14188 [Caenorhabditis remanei]